MIQRVTWPELHKHSNMRSSSDPSEIMTWTTLGLVLPWGLLVGYWSLFSELFENMLKG